MSKLFKEAQTLWALLQEIKEEERQDSDLTELVRIMRRMCSKKITSHDLFDMTIDEFLKTYDSSCTDRQALMRRTSFRNLGLVFMGEFFHHPLNDFRGDRNHGKIMSMLILDNFCHLSLKKEPKRHLIEDLGKQVLSWVPKYWQDPKFLAIINKPVTDTTMPPQVIADLEDVQVIGDLFRKSRSVSWIQEKLRVAGVTDELWAGAILPEEWRTRTIYEVNPFVEKWKEAQALRQSFLDQRLSPHKDISPEIFVILCADLEGEELGVRVQNLLRNYGIKKVGELIRFTKKSLLKKKGFGRDAVRELDYFLGEKGLSFGKILPEEVKELFPLKEF